MGQWEYVKKIFVIILLVFFSTFAYSQELFETAQRIIDTYTPNNLPERVEEIYKNFDFSPAEVACGRYSVAFKKLSNNSRVFIVIGTTSSGINHAWNVVISGDKLYWWDITWAETDPNKYLNSDILWETHTITHVFLYEKYNNGIPRGIPIDSLKELKEILKTQI
jgi:hypothetical protein